MLQVDASGLLAYIPLFRELRSQHLSSRALIELTSHSGDLPLEIQAQISNWFQEKLPGARQEKQNWLGQLPLSHGYTLVIASQHREEFRSKTTFPKDGTMVEQEIFLLDAAWQLQRGSEDTKYTGSKLRAVDVDQECISSLEYKLFQRSKEAGIASLCQWGLDVGPHQDGWNPYSQVPTEWHIDDFGTDLDQSELQVSCSGSLVNGNCALLICASIQPGPKFAAQITGSQIKRKTNSNLPTVRRSKRSKVA